jgi:hypothetical protein
MDRKVYSALKCFIERSDSIRGEGHDALKYSKSRRKPDTNPFRWIF